MTSKKPNYKIIFSSIFIVLLIAIVSYYIYSKNNVSIKSTNTGNIVANNNSGESKTKIYKTVKEYAATLDTSFNKNLDLLNKPFFIKVKVGSIEKTLRLDIKNTDYKGEKDSIIQDLGIAYKNKQIYPEVTSKESSGIKMVDPASVSKNAKFSQDLISGNIINMLTLKKQLINKNNKNNLEVSQLSYIYDLEGNYKDKENLCKNNTACIKDTVVTITGNIKDNKGNIISGAQVYLLNDNSISASTGKDGSYKLTYKTNGLSNLRIRAVKEGYSDGISNIRVVFESKKHNFTKDFILIKPLKSLTYDKADLSDGKVEIIGELSNYDINTKGLVDKDGKTVSPEKITAQVFEFSRSDSDGVLGGYLNLDIFYKSGNYGGASFVTYGMPYLILRDEKGNELFISKKNPSIIKDKIANLEELLKEKQSIPGKNGDMRKTITQEDIDKMVEVSSKSKISYPIDSIYADKNNLIMPLKWTLNEQRGVWEEVGARMLDSDGNYESIFYNAD